MSKNPERATCPCGAGKASAYDGKCGHCRNRREREAHKRMLAGWSRDDAQRGYRTRCKPAAEDEFGIPHT